MPNTFSLIHNTYFCQDLFSTAYSHCLMLFLLSVLNRIHEFMSLLECLCDLKCSRLVTLKSNQTLMDWYDFPIVLWFQCHATQWIGENTLLLPFAFTTTQFSLLFTEIRKSLLYIVIPHNNRMIVFTINTHNSL